MQRLTPILVTLSVLLGSAGKSFALPECPGSPTNTAGSWTDSFGIQTVSSGKFSGFKYVGKHKDDKTPVKQFIHAADQGNVFFQVGLGEMYLEGKGITQLDLNL